LPAFFYLKILIFIKKYIQIENKTCLMTTNLKINDFSKEVLEKCNTWPFQEAKKIINRLKYLPEDKLVVFETGYGPSGLPHIGTFCEVFRTNLVRKAFTLLTGRPSKLICFSDDMDGLRKVPSNIPNQQNMSNFIGHPLTKVPDPFQTHSSFGEHNNSRLKSFLDSFNFEYEFYSATDCYKSGLFDKTLIKVLDNYEKIKQIILPTLGEERRKTYSPFLPICEKTGKVLEVSIDEINKTNGTITYTDPAENEKVTISVTGGKCKLQWKCDWAMRWDALGVDYEMAGKDLIDSVALSSKINKQIGSRPPEGFNYELFLDQNGEKISKSKGNGLTIEEWLSYGPQESLSYFMYGHPKRAKRLYFDVIPKSVDEYLTQMKNFISQSDEEQLNNPSLYVHNIQPSEMPKENTTIPFSLLLNLASVCHAEDPEIIWGFIEKYSPGTKLQNNKFLENMVNLSVVYFNDMIKPNKKYRLPDDNETKALKELSNGLIKLDKSSSSEEIQKLVFSIGKENNFENLRDWFKSLYEILLGQSEGPRMGSFISLYGIKETKNLIDDALLGKLK
jgi:lysyl-tRNA synthetase class 1